MKDFLIIGQGVAGSFLAWELLKRGKSLTIVDDHHKGSSSIISAGIINPVTGKRFVLTEEFDSFFAHALKTYQELEAKFDTSFFEPLDILRVFRSTDERDYWEKRVELNAYGKQINSPNTFHTEIKDPQGSVIVQSTGFCHTARLLNVLKEYFQNENILALQKFSYDDLRVDGNSVRFGNESFGTVIFCQGYQAQWNPWFEQIPFNSVKGEILKIKIENVSLPHMIINKGKWCAPLNQEEWMAGSSYIWDHLDCEPTQEACDQIISGLNGCFDSTISITDHKAGVRPVIKDQKAVLGRHPQINNLAIFNGLGSKGFLTAPLYAAHFADYLTGLSSLKEDIALDRFKERFT